MSTIDYKWYNISSCSGKEDGDWACCPLRYRSTRELENA